MHFLQQKEISVHANKYVADTKLFEETKTILAFAKLMILYIEIRSERKL
jgi:hypothetical protein